MLKHKGQKMRNCLNTVLILKLIVMAVIVFVFNTFEGQVQSASTIY